MHVFLCVVRETFSEASHTHGVELLFYFIFPQTLKTFLLLGQFYRESQNIPTRKRVQPRFPSGQLCIAKTVGSETHRAQGLSLQKRTVQGDKRKSELGTRQHFDNILKGPSWFCHIGWGDGAGIGLVPSLWWPAKKLAHTYRSSASSKGSPNEVIQFHLPDFCQAQPIYGHLGRESLGNSFPKCELCAKDWRWGVAGTLQQLLGLLKKYRVNKRK